MPTDDSSGAKKGARDMRTAGLVITLSIVLSLIVAALIVIFGHIQIY